MRSGLFLRSTLATLWTSQVVRFGALGALNNLLSYAIFVVLTTVGVPPLVGITITYALGMVFSYLGNRSFTFKHSGSARRSLLRFVVTNAVGYAINVTIIAIFVEAVGWNPLIVQLGAIAVVASFTFVSMRFWVFSEHGKHPGTIGRVNVEEPTLGS